MGVVNDVVRAEATGEELNPLMISHTPMNRLAREDIDIMQEN
jgi:hypothetical protein